MRDDDGDPIQELLRNLNTSRIPRIPPRAILIGLLVLIGVIAAWTMFYTVEADEVAVVQRFGRYVRRETPGLHSRLPLGLETVRKVKVQRVLKTEFGFRTEEPGVRTRFSPQGFPEEALMLTGDLNVGDVKWIVQYRNGMALRIRSRRWTSGLFWWRLRPAGGLQIRCCFSRPLVTNTRRRAAWMI